MSAKIIIIGSPKYIYNIVKYNRKLIQRGVIEIEGDVENPNAKKNSAKKEEGVKLKTKEEKNGPTSDKNGESKAPEKTKKSAKKNPAKK